MNPAVSTPRLLLVAPSAQRTGGGDEWLAGLLRHLGRADAPAVVFEADGELAGYARCCGCTTLVLPGAGNAASGDVSGLVAPLAGVLARHRPDVTVFWSPRAQLYGWRAHLLAGRPGRTAWVQHVMPSDFWLHLDASRSPTDLVICVSRAVARRQRELCPQHPTLVVHPGRDAPPASLSRSAARARLGCADAGQLIGVVGRVEPWKGQDIAVRMLAALTAREAAVHLVIFGRKRSANWPGFSCEVTALIGELGMTRRVTFAGHCRDVPGLLPALDILVCASREEGFGLAIVEAMAAGVPVVATCCGGPEDIIDHDVTGLLVPAEDPVALADAVSRVLRDPGVGVSLASRARRAWAERFTAAHSAEAFRAAVACLAAARPCPSSMSLRSGAVVGDRMQIMRRDIIS